MSKVLALAGTMVFFMSTWAATETAASWPVFGLCFGGLCLSLYFLLKK